MSNKPNCSSCESLKEQIEEIKKGQIEDCQKQNEENKRRIVGMQGKIMALTIASTVALTIVGQEAVEKIQKNSCGASIQMDQTFREKQDLVFATDGQERFRLGADGNI